MTRESNVQHPLFAEDRLLHVLLVEDNPADVLMVREAIRSSSVKADVLVAYDGEQALRFLRELLFKPDLVILDLNLPKHGGLEILRRHRENHGAPVIVFTASDRADDRRAALALGAKDYIVKPTNMDAYMKAVRGALERATGLTGTNEA